MTQNFVRQALQVIHGNINMLYDREDEFRRDILSNSLIHLPTLLTIRRETYAAIKRHLSYKHQSRQGTTHSEEPSHS